jgi:hypothetical protein
VARYLKDHCSTMKLKLCPYRNQLPATADEFLWGDSMFNTLGRFEGMEDEMGFITLHSVAEYPGMQVTAALAATAEQLIHVATGEGTHVWIPHTYGIIEHYMPEQLSQMRAARQQRGQLDLAELNAVHVPVALTSMLLLVAIIGAAIQRRQLEDLALFGGTVALALLGNAFVCGVISGPHDRYGARMVWIATFVALIAAARKYDSDAMGSRLQGNQFQLSDVLEGS